MIITHPEHMDMIQSIKKTIEKREKIATEQSYKSNSATEQFYDISAGGITLRPYSIVNNQLRFVYGTGSLEHYADIGGSYYLYVPDSITAINTTTSYPASNSVLVKIGDDSMYGYKFRGTPWNIGDEINVYEYATGNTVFTLVLTDDYSLGYVGAGLPVPPVYPENNIGVPDFNGITGRTEMRIYDDDATTMTLFGIPNNPVLNRNSNYYLYIPDDQNEIKMVYPFWIRNESKNRWWNTGAHNYLSGNGLNARGTEWSVGDLLKIDNNSSLSNPLFVTITNIPSN